VSAWCQCGVYPDEAVLGLRLHGIVHGVVDQAEASAEGKDKCTLARGAGN
jgi:hypothetical protein